MSAKMPGRSDRYERFFRSLLGLALAVGVAWALTHGGVAPGVGPVH